MGTPVLGCASLVLVLVLTLGLEDRAEGCSCFPAHPQTHFCNSEIVIRAKIMGEKIVSPSNSSSPYMKDIQYEIKVIKMFKGFEKVKDIQYVYTPVYSSLCGVPLDSSNKVQYLLSGGMWNDGKLSIGLCDYIKPWDDLSATEKRNLNYRYQMGCNCRITTCFSEPCSPASDECLWTDWLPDNSLSGNHARQVACIKRSDGSCTWAWGFMDMSNHEQRGTPGSLRDTAEYFVSLVPSWSTPRNYRCSMHPSHCVLGPPGAPACNGTNL
ncbi:hypothetical protein SKAU_G00176040 [Synaphobranchus kaupii]|uniref:Metalloproteinase inhibitor 4 n=1 Tax=Synaphobranchus kaupii TaxID=118154 RepID=A0A9Q1IZ25_SYNKA|nr:hypothetical protein SKAU_G00176040 [Synaphobranchus kaupii]